MTAVGEPALGRLAVVVLTFDSAATIGDCLASLRPELRPGDIAVVADNASADGTVAVVQREHGWVELVANGSNLGFAAGNNRAMAPLLARGFEFVLVLNPDTVIEPGAIAALRAAADGATGAASLQPLLLRGGRRGDATVVDSLGLRPRRSFGGADLGHGTAVPAGPAAPTPIFGACGAAAFYRCSALQQAGLFDEELFLLAEDLDLAFRLRLHGGEALLVPAARVRHRRGISGQQLDRVAARRRKHWLQRNTVALALRYWPPGLLLLHLPHLAWRIAQALWLTRSNRGQPCLPLWRQSLGRRRESRRAMTAHGVDRWFA